MTETFLTDEDDSGNGRSSPARGAECAEDFCPVDAGTPADGGGDADKLALALVLVDVAGRDLREAADEEFQHKVLAAVDLVTRGIRSAALALDATGPVTMPQIPAGIPNRDRLREAERLMTDCASRLDPASRARFDGLTRDAMRTLFMRTLRRAPDPFQLALTGLA